MPNYVKNKIRFSGPDKDVREMLEKIKNDELGIGTIDFKKVIPMPESLMIECGSRTTNGLKAVDTYIREHGCDHLVNPDYADDLKYVLDAHKSELPEDDQETWDICTIAAVNILKYGYPTWYEWSIDNWGTKWNACGYEEGIDYSEDECLDFDTAWSAPIPIIEKLAATYPSIAFEHKWADEDFGNNVGHMEYKDGELTVDMTPDSHKECLELAGEVWDYDLAEFGYMLNQNGDDYIYADGDDFELIELFDQDALFTNDRLTPADVPKGLYLYHLRMTDDGEQFGSIENNVTVNHGGSILTKEPLDLGSSGCIEFTDETSPNFLGQDITMHDFVDDEYTLDEDISQSMA